jgi:deoxyribonuclease (pyrimidine dimer)
MTRINVIPPRELIRQHLLAEYRELPRVFGLVRRAQQRGERPDMSAVPAYTLGKGHVRFFYPRLKWLRKRYDALRKEMTRRGYKMSIYGNELYAGIDDAWWSDWRVTDEAIKINRARIKDKISLIQT